MRLVHRLSVLRRGATPVATTRGQNQLREASGSGSAIPQGASCRAGMGWCPLPSSQTLLSKAPLREGVPSPFLAPPPHLSLQPQLPLTHGVRDAHSVLGSPQAPGATLLKSGTTLQGCPWDCWPLRKQGCHLPLGSI